MLARLLRYMYALQVLGGALLGVYLAPKGAALSGGVLGAVLLPLSSQFLLIAVSMVRCGGDAPSAQWWTAFGGEFRAALVVFAGRLPWSSRCPGVLMPNGRSTVDRQNSAVPVLLVHGYICNHRVWDDVVPALHQAGHPVLAIDLEPLFTSIDDYAAHIDAAVTELLAQSGGEQVALVGHSMGGLAIRAWMRAHGTQRVARVITLGTPHQGTRVASVSRTPNGEQMDWHSPWVKALEQSETPATRHLMQLALTHQDNIVYPQREQRLAGATVTEFSGIGHLQMCLDQKVIQWLVQQLGK